MDLSSARELLRKQFGFDDFRPGQSDVIGHLLSGRSAAAVFPTGGGKSLCYQLPAQLISGLTIVVSPLIALMKDQIDGLKRRGVAAERLDSTLSAEESSSVMRRVRDGSLRLLYVAPERFNNERFRESMARIKIGLFAVDEAHCISEWGHSFRPDYLKLARFAKTYRAERVLALTATATPQVLDDVCREFAIEPRCAVRTGFYRPNLTLVTTPVAAAERNALLLKRLQGSPPGPTIIYVTLQRTAEAVAERLAAAGLSARPYHAGMEDDLRAHVQEWFMQSQAGIVVATIAFGMGVDKADIRYVYHYNLAKSLENYSQEIGRAGRDGKKSTCELLVCPDDLCALENFAHGDTPTRASVRGLLGDVFANAADFDISTYECAGRHDIRPLVVQTLLTYLELDGYLQAGTPFYSRYSFQPLVSSQEMLSRFEGERREFLANVLRHTEKARTWFHIDLDKTADVIQQPRDRIVRAFDYLAEQRLIELRAEGVRQTYRLLKKPGDLEALADDLFRRLTEREQREIERLQAVLSLAGHDGCQVALLAGHFGERLEKPCGHCSWCTNGGQPTRLLPRPQRAIDDATWRRAQALATEKRDVLGEPRALARFLCGLTSPRLSAARLGGNPLFGAFADVPFAKVLERAIR
ncbi:MAG TPA: RecQ family ATP-dependent DNA helicase [Pirellulales bacterium]|nr:RecQ family ATP-dependent DNA helicase [Pirellulales bacterium]